MLIRLLLPAIVAASPARKVRPKAKGTVSSQQLTYLSAISPVRLLAYQRILNDGPMILEVANTIIPSLD